MEPFQSDRPCPLFGSTASSTQLHRRERPGASSESGGKNVCTETALTAVEWAEDPVPTRTPMRVSA